MQPFISILMPVYNAAPFLAECLDSICNQSYQNWELLAVDDYSKDQSKTILEAYAQKDKRIKVYQNHAKGIIPALRLALKKSKGNFITRMDADDLMPLDKLSKMQALLKEQGGGSIVTGLVEYFSASGIRDGYRRYEAWLNSILLEGRTYEEIYRECVIPSPAWMIHREDLMKCGAFETSTYPEDYDLVFRFYEAGLEVSAVPDLVHYWRDHPERSSRTMEQYANAAYFALKVPYFLKLDHDPKRPLVIWGAGKKGKAVAQLLLDQQVDFHWLCDNPAKIGLSIYGVPLFEVAKLESFTHPQVLVVVSNPEEQLSIRNYLHQLDLAPGRDYFFMV
ncbi:MAG: glycosyltransferase family 2 protein [Bacteroidota bacterium]